MAGEGVDTFATHLPILETINLPSAPPWYPRSQ
jgi:hypothetical protein